MSAAAEILCAFPPILPDRPHTLILGTMPGGKSLQRNQYYAHPQNQFWRFMGDLYGAGRDLPYEDRVEAIRRQGIAIWDVVQSCVRPGSMDADIRDEVVNDFESFFTAHRAIRLVVFDSLTAEHIYRRKVLPNLKRDLEYRRVPSPSPAYARMTYGEKLVMWKAVLPPRRTDDQ